MSSTRRKYTREFKIEAVKLSYNSAKPVEKIAEDLGVSQSSLNRCRSEFRVDPDQAFPGNEQIKERDADVACLKKELKQAQQEHEIVKKVGPSLRQAQDRLQAEAAVKFQFIEEHRGAPGSIPTARVTGSRSPSRPGSQPQHSRGRPYLAVDFVFLIRHC